MERRSFSREFKVEAVRLVRERRVSVAQAARELWVGSPAKSSRRCFGHMLTSAANAATIC